MDLRASQEDPQNSRDTFVKRMPITQADLARLIKAAAHDRKERFQLVSLAGKQPGIVYELDEDEVVDYLRTELRKEGASSSQFVTQEQFQRSQAREKVTEADVQLFYEVLLRRLHSLSNRDDLYVLATSRSGIGHKKPNLCISTSPLKAAVARAYPLELKILLIDTTSRQEATSQCLERVRLILANQQHRSTCYAVAGGADAIELWRYTGAKADACSGPLLLSWEARSAGLQALVRLWSMTLEQLGYVPTSMPIVQSESAMLNNVMLLTSTSSREADLVPLPGTTVLQGDWEGRTVVAKTSRRIDDEEQALIATQHVGGIVKLLETVTCGSTKWLIMGPVGEELPFSPASVVLTHMDELASCVERLHGVGWLHCDISYFNCIVFQPDGKAGFIDLGAAKTISEHYCIW
ncbi:hypothetical protein WJX75_001584 [Coccomyxa subellipsoidea]|uniref:Protein kinase domain-containing protein n=1 Tax=Coccomyxa subellipsoidea TaxID=248742 RepID=A0ABR2YFW4_9CHLO